MIFFANRSFSYQVGDEIAGYRVVARAGLGGFGEVYLVEDISGARFALKLFSDRRELDALTRYRELAPSPRLAAIHAAGTFQDQTYYLVDAADNLRKLPDYVPDTLANRLAANGAFSAADALQTILEILHGMEALHKIDLAHGDIKPENVIFVRGELKIADFGSLAFSDNVTSGTGGFLPPETVEGIPTLADGISRDLYAIGKLLYVLYSNRAPEEFPLPKEHADAREFALIRKLYARACHAKAQYRFRSATEMRQAVEKALGKLQSPPQAKRRLVYAAFALLLIAATGGIVFFSHRQKCMESALFLATLNEESLACELAELEEMKHFADRDHLGAIEKRIDQVQTLLKMKRLNVVAPLDREVKNALPLDRDILLSGYRKELLKDPLLYLTSQEWQTSAEIVAKRRPANGRPCMIYNMIQTMREKIQSEAPQEQRMQIRKIYSNTLKQLLVDWQQYKEQKK